MPGLRADPDDGSAYTTKAYVLLRWYRTPSQYGADEQRPLLDRITEAATRAVEIDRACPSAWRALGTAYLHRAEYERSHGGQAAPWWTRAVDGLGKALALRPGDPRIRDEIGEAQRWLAKLETPAPDARDGRDGPDAEDAIP